MDLYVDGKFLTILQVEEPSDDSFVFDSDTNHLTTFTKLSEHCIFNDIFIRYDGIHYRLGVKKDAKKVIDLRLFDVQIVKKSLLICEQPIKEKVNKVYINRLNNIKMLAENKLNISQNLTNIDKSKLKDVSNITQFLMLGEEKITPIVESFNYFFQDIDTSLLCYIIDNMEKNQNLEKVLYEMYTKVHIEVLKNKS
jgi:hypothetical protein